MSWITEIQHHQQILSRISFELRTRSKAFNILGLTDLSDDMLSYSKQITECSTAISDEISDYLTQGLSDSRKDIALTLKTLLDK